MLLQLGQVVLAVLVAVVTAVRLVLTQLRLGILQLAAVVVQDGGLDKRHPLAVAVAVAAQEAAILVRKRHRLELQIKVMQAVVRQTLITAVVVLAEARQALVLVRQA